MITVNIQPPPFDPTSEWQEPVDSDLRFISAACWWVCKQAQVMSSAGMQLRQATEADVSSAITSAESSINNLLANLTSAYQPPEGP